MTNSRAAPPIGGNFAWTPDSRQLLFAYTTRAHKDEVWLMENFLPVPKGGK